MKRGPSKDKQLDFESVFKPIKNLQRMKEVKALSLCMMEVFCVLETDDSAQLPIDIRVRELAMIGAVGRLFERLLHGEEKVGKKLFHFPFLSGLRAVLYHINDPLSQLNIGAELKRDVFFRHIYDYCRTELHTLFGKAIYPSLSIPCDIKERDTDPFKEAIHYAITEGKIHRRKLKPELQKRLADNTALFDVMIKRLQANPGFGVVDDSEVSLRHADVMRGNAIGALIALISQDATALEKGDFYLSEEAEHKSALSRDSRYKMMKTYLLFHQIGNHYRYRYYNVNTILEKYQVQAISSGALQTKIDEAIKNQQVAQVQALFPQWAQHPSVMKSNIVDDPTVGNWLLKASEQGCLSMVQYLFRHPVRNSWRAFAVVRAAMHGRVDTLQWLLTAQKWSVDLVNYAIDCAESAKQHATLTVLQNHWREHNVTLCKKPIVETESDRDIAQEQCMIEQLEKLLISDDSDSDSEMTKDEPLTPLPVLRFSSQPATRAPVLYVAFDKKSSKRTCAKR